MLKFEQEGVEPGIAVEFGCGNSPIVTDLLNKGWKVRAVDNSQVALNCLRQQVKRAAPDNLYNLTPECVDMEVYEFPRHTRLIVAKDALPYCDPGKIVEVWDKAYNSLEIGGRIVGNFFPTPCDPMVGALSRGMMGTWYTDKAVVKALLDKNQYEVELCEYSKPRYAESLFNEPRQINFIGQKV